MSRFDLASLVDLDRHPIDRPGSSGCRSLVDRARSELRERGCAVIPDFLRPVAVETLAAEIAACKHATHYSREAINPYFHTEIDGRFPEHHPVNTFLERSSGFIPGDAWDAGSAIDVLFRSPDLARFLADALEIPELHCYADPLAGLTANILEPGQQFTWHFDTNEFAVTVLVDEADAGGQFEFVPNARSEHDEAFDRVQRILEGDRTDVVTLDLRPGDLQIFRGRHSLHRVTRVGPMSASRHAAILAYTEQPCVIGRVARTRQLFGRVLDAHLEAERQRVRSDALID
jgi:hypothetical protein